MHYTKYNSEKKNENEGQESSEILNDMIISFITLFLQTNWRQGTLTQMLLVSNLANTKWCKKSEKWLKPWGMDTHLRVLSKIYPISTNMTGFRGFSKIFASLCFGRK